MPDARLERTRRAYPDTRRAAQLAATWVSEKNRADARAEARHAAPIRLSDTIGTDHWNTIESQDH